MSNQPDTNKFEFDVFLAHNHDDKPQIRIIAHELKLRFIKPWFDEEQVPPGTPFGRIIQEAIPKVKSAAIFIGKNGLGNWQQAEQQALFQRCVGEGIAMIPVLLPGVDHIPEDISNLFCFQLYSCVKFDRGIYDVKALDALEWGITKRKPRREHYGILVNIPSYQTSCFLAMPKQGLDSVYESLKDVTQKVSVKQLVNNRGIELIQTKNKSDQGFVGDINEIIHKIRSSEVVVGVCVSEEKSYQLDPDVAYELGLAHALGKPLCIISDNITHKSLSNYILNDIPEDEFIDYELSPSEETLSDKLKNKLEEILKSLHFPYLVEPRNQEITAIDWEETQCFIPRCRENFCKILDCGLKIHKQFPYLQTLLTSLYKEVEEVADTLDNPSSSEDINKEIQDVINAWEVYNQQYEQLYPVNSNERKCREFKDTRKFQSLEQSFYVLMNEGTTTTKRLAGKSYLEYIKVIQRIEDYPRSHKKLSSTLEEKNVDDLLQRSGIVDSLKDDIETVIKYIDTLVYKRTGLMIEYLGKMICSN